MIKYPKEDTSCDIFSTCSEYRDQGLTRPKVLIVLPFREAALRVVNMMIGLLKSDDQVIHCFFIDC